MEKEQSLQIIEQALNVANVKGVFKLEESATIFTALTIVKKVFEDLKIQETTSKIVKTNEEK